MQCVADGEDAVFRHAAVGDTVGVAHRCTIDRDDYVLGVPSAETTVKVSVGPLSARTRSSAVGEHVGRAPALVTESAVGAAGCGLRDEFRSPLSISEIVSAPLAVRAASSFLTAPVVTPPMVGRSLVPLIVTTTVSVAVPSAEVTETVRSGIFRHLAPAPQNCRCRGCRSRCPAESTEKVPC